MVIHDNIFKFNIVISSFKQINFWSNESSSL